MSWPVFRMAVRLRLLATALSALGMLLVIVMVGALFPAVGGSIGKLDLPKGVSELLGGADYGNIAGWMRSEIGAVYGPLVVGALAITGAAGSTAGEEQDGVLSLTLSYPIARWRLMLSKASAVAAGVLLVAAGTFAGLVVGVAVGGGGVPAGHLAALCVHLAFFGFAIGALALAVAAVTGRRPVASGATAAFALAAYLVNGFAPLISGVGWLKYLSLYYYYAGSDPIGTGLDASHLVVLAVSALLFTTVAAVAIGRRDLRG